MSERRMIHEPLVRLIMIQRRTCECCNRDHYPAEPVVGTLDEINEPTEPDRPPG